MMAVVAEPDEKARAYFACSSAAMASSKLSLGESQQCANVCLQAQPHTGLDSRSACTRNFRRVCLRLSERMSSKGISIEGNSFSS